MNIETKSALELVDPDVKELIPRDYWLGKPDIALKGKRQPVRQRSDISSYQGGSKINITVPPVMYYGKNAKLTFNGNVTPSTVPGTYDSFQFPIQTIFSRVRVYVGSDLVEDIESYDALVAAMSQSWASTLKGDSKFNFDEGIADQTLRHLYSGNNLRYSVDLRLDSLNGFLPLEFMGKALRIELTLNRPADCLESDAAAPDATDELTEVYLEYHKMTLNQDFRKMLIDSINAGTYVVPYTSWAHFENQWSGNAFQTEIPSRYRNILRFLGMQREATAIGSWQLDSFTRYAIINYTSLSLKINNVLYPEDKNTSLASDPFQSTLARDYNVVMNKWSKSLARQGDSLQYFDPGPLERAIVAFDLREDVDDAHEVYANGVDTSRAGSSYVFQLTSSVAEPQTQINTYTQYESTMKITAGGNVEIVY